MPGLDELILGPGGEIEIPEDQVVQSGFGPGADSFRVLVEVGHFPTKVLRIMLELSGNLITASAAVHADIVLNIDFASQSLVSQSLATTRVTHDSTNLVIYEFRYATAFLTDNIIAYELLNARTDFGFTAQIYKTSVVYVAPEAFAASASFRGPFGMPANTTQQFGMFDVTVNNPSMSDVPSAQTGLLAWSNGYDLRFNATRNIQLYDATNATVLHTFPTTLDVGTTARVAYSYSDSGGSSTPSVTTIEGSWKLAPEVGAITWHTHLSTTNHISSDRWNDVNTFSPDGTFSTNFNGSTSVYNFQNGGPDHTTGTPIYPYDSTVPATWTRDGNTLMLHGKGAYLALANVYNGGEYTGFSNSDDLFNNTADSLTYTIIEESLDRMKVHIKGIIDHNITFVRVPTATGSFDLYKDQQLVDSVSQTLDLGIVAAVGRTFPYYTSETHATRLLGTMRHIYFYDQAKDASHVTGFANPTPGTDGVVYAWTVATNTPEIAAQGVRIPRSSRQPELAFSVVQWTPPADTAVTVSSQSGLTAPLVLVVNNECTLRATFTGAGDEFQTAVVAELIASVNVSVAGAAPVSVNVASATIDSASRTIDFAFTATSKAEHVFTIHLKDPLGVTISTNYTMTIASSAVFDFPNMTGVSKSPSVVTLGQPLTITSTWASALPTGTTLAATYQPSGGSVDDATVGSFNHANTACTYTFVVDAETSYTGIVTLTVGPALKQYAWTGPHVVPSFTLAGSDIHVFPDAFTVSGEVKELVGTTITLTFSGGDMLHQTGGNSVPLQIEYIKFTQAGVLYDILSSDITTSHSYETVTVSNFTPPGLGNITMHAVLRGPDHEQGDPVLSPEITATILGTAIEPATLSPPPNMIVYADFSGYTYTLTGDSFGVDKTATRNLLESMLTYTEEKFQKSSTRYRTYHDNYVGISNGNDSMIAVVTGAGHATVNGTTLPRFQGYSGWQAPGWTLDDGRNHPTWGQSDITWTTMTDIFAFKVNLPFSQWNGANFAVADSSYQWTMSYKNITWQHGHYNSALTSNTSAYVGYDASIHNTNGSTGSPNIPMDGNTMGFAIGLKSQSNSNQPMTFWTHGEIPLGDYIYVVEIKQTFDNASTSFTTVDGGEATIYCYNGTSWHSSTKALMSRKSHASGQINWSQYRNVMGWANVGDSTWGGHDNTWMGWAIQDNMSQATRDAIIGYYSRTLAGSSPLSSPRQIVFSNDATWTVPAGVTDVEILVVAGGGSGGPGPISLIPGNRTGGGAGGLIHITNWNISGASTVTVTVGAGGAVYMDGTIAASNGEDSTVSTDAGHLLTAKGGGHGGHILHGTFFRSGDGGSGGGGMNSSGDYLNGVSTQSSDTNDQVNTYTGTGHGHKGGEGWMWHGGGAGETDLGIWPMTSAGAGLDLSASFGTSVGDDGWFASGGTTLNNGSQQIRRNYSKGGGGEGHNGEYDQLLAYTGMAPRELIADGHANTGGGGGGCGSGGSGVVIIKYS